MGLSRSLEIREDLRVKSLAIQPPFPALALVLPAWMRGILLAVSAEPDSHLEVVPSAQSEDDAAIAAVRGGDPNAYRQIIQRHQATIARRMTRFARDRATIEELVHDCFVEAYVSLPSYRGNAPLEHWLTKIATRVGYRHWKTRRRDRARMEKLQAEPAPLAGSAAAGDTAELVHYLLDQLSPRDRLAITLLHLEGHSVAEAARLAGWSQTLLKVQAYRARKKLRALLKQQGIDHG
jgi:RNA polymerase sigma-70 factor (ECF subfamily)